MTDSERVPHIIARLMRALDYDRDRVIEAAWDLLEIRLSDLPTQQLRRRFQSLRDRFAPATRRSRKPSMPADPSKVLEEAREFLVEMLTQSKISAKLIHGFCPSCSARRKSVVLASHVHRWELAHDVWSVEILRVLRCGACSTIYSQKEYIDHLSCQPPLLDDSGDDLHSTGVPILDSDIRYWAWVDSPARAPAAASARLDSLLEVEKTRREPPRSIKFLDDELIKTLLHESYYAFDPQMITLAAIGMRCVLDRATVLLGAAPEDGFAKKLNTLERDGHITSRQRGTLDVLVDAGNAAAHARWRPEQEHLNVIIFETMEDFLKNTLFTPKRIHQLKASVPPKPRRTPAATVVSIATGRKRDS